MELKDLLNLKKEDFNSVMQIKNLFNSAGWLIFEYNILENLKVLNYNIQKLTSGEEVLDAKNLELLKTNIAERKALRYVLLIKIQLLNDVDPTWEEQINSDRFGIEKELETSPAFSRGA